MRCAYEANVIREEVAEEAELEHEEYKTKVVPCRRRRRRWAGKLWDRGLAGGRTPVMVESSKAFENACS